MTTGSVGGAGAHLVGQLATNQKPQGRIPVRAKSIYHCSSVSTQHVWIAWTIGPDESKGGEESNGKLSHNAACQEQSGPYSWFPDAWTKRGTHVTLLVRLRIF
ncbi:hypothetical protein PoB_006594500 [Plakobranchus ocellatus]|uniref:Uncharacterized protein n=1 Tax=Plakobranchus ocellatus TaxID=259542 RepID=A0AAV4D5S4_9GAST|nr:hypothetical protein PoB_006594500 [Plakobranchus ocellatus]